MSIYSTTSATTTSSTASTASTSSTSSSSSSGTSSTSSTDASDRFLTLLVTQLENQDPLNPMDNAEVTSQMAQIQTVTGIEKLNTTVASLGTQMTLQQTLAATALVGHETLVSGTNLEVADGKVDAGYQLASAADDVSVQVLDSSGNVLDTVDLGDQTSGAHSFTWTPPSGVDASKAATLKYTATSGSSSVAVTNLELQKITAVSSTSSGTSVELADGRTVALDALTSVR